MYFFDRDRTKSLDKRNRMCINAMYNDKLFFLFFMKNINGIKDNNTRKKIRSFDFLIRKLIGAVSLVSCPPTYIPECANKKKGHFVWKMKIQFK